MIRTEDLRKELRAHVRNEIGAERCSKSGPSIR